MDAPVPNPHRRQFARVPFRASVELETAPGPRTCELVDLSLKGALLMGERPWEAAPGDPCSLMIELAQASEPIFMQAEVAHVEGLRLGIRCTAIDLDSVTRLRRVIELNLGDEEALGRELSAMVGEAPGR